MSSDEKKCLPGWNDPPLLNYDNKNPPPKSRIGNKRIAFPISNQGSTKNETVSSIPQPISELASSISQTSATLDTDKVSDVWDSQKELEVVNDNLKLVLLKSEEEDNKDVVRRLKVMEDMWRKGQFDEKLEKCIADLSKELKDGNGERVQQLQVQLMMEYPTLCSPWIAAIRLLGRTLN